MNDELTDEQASALRTWSNVGMPGAPPEQRYRPTPDQLIRSFFAISRPRPVEFDLPLSERDVLALRLGHRAEAMEDKWNVYCDDDNVVHFHRSWTGYEIFRFELLEEPDGGGVRARNLLIEGDDSTYRPADMAEAIESLFELLGWVFDFDRAGIEQSVSYSLDP
jgi:hypothetical protein